MMKSDIAISPHPLGSWRFHPTSDVMTENAPLTTFYNASCPVCRMEIDHYRRLSARDSLNMDWQDTSADRALLESHGIRPEDVLKRLYVVDGGGNLLGGIDAFLVIWKTIPSYRWLAKIVGLPVIRHIASVLYDYVVAPLIFHWNRVSGRI